MNDSAMDSHMIQCATDSLLWLKSFESTKSAVDIASVAHRIRRHFREIFGYYYHLMLFASSGRSALRTFGHIGTPIIRTRGFNRIPSGKYIKYSFGIQPHSSRINSITAFSTLSPKQTHSRMGESEPSKPLRYVDIGINLSDPMFQGHYHGKQAHESDLDDVIQRAKDVGCEKFMVTGSDLEESQTAIQIARDHPGFCYATVGVHPCQANLFDKYPGGPEKMIDELRKMATEAKNSGLAVAFGEIGLDYDRLFHSEKEPQLKYFAAQLDLAIEIQMPLFLHSRAASEDFERLLSERLPRLPKGGLVHSFTGTMEEMQRLVALGVDIGVNGCSMKTEENLEVVKAIPLERLQIETDGPWCEIRPSHASAKFLQGAPELPKSVKKEKWQKGFMVKGRNEPVAIARVAHVIAHVKGISVEEVCEAAWNNSTKMFGLGIEA